MAWYTTTLSALMTCALCLFQGSCAPRITPIATDIVREDTYRVSLLEEQDKTGKVIPKGFDHPWDVDSGTLYRLLTSIYYQKEILLYNLEPSRAFPEKELKAMLPYVQKAFAAAGPNHYIEFSFSERKTWTVLRRTYLTDGVLFRKGPTLHCAFRNIAYEERGPSDESYGPYLENPTSRPVSVPWSLVPGPGQQLEIVKDPLPLGSTTYPNWIKLDIAAILESPGDTTEHEKPMPMMPSTQNGSYQSTDQWSPQSREEVKDKLRFLEELHEQGLISGSSYEEKRKELLKVLETLPLAQ